MTDLCKLEFDWKTQTVSLFVDVNKIANEVAEQLDEEVLRMLGFEKVKHGRWLGERGEYVCSVCGCEGPEDGGYWYSPFCPSCGAKMDLK